MDSRRLKSTPGIERTKFLAADGRQHEVQILDKRRRAWFLLLLLATGLAASRCKPPGPPPPPDGPGTPPVIRSTGCHLIDIPNRVYRDCDFGLAMSLPPLEDNRVLAELGRQGFLLRGEEPGGALYGLRTPIADDTIEAELDAILKAVRAGPRSEASSIEGETAIVDIDRAGKSFTATAQYVYGSKGRLVLYYELLDVNRHCLARRLDDLRHGIVPGDKIVPPPIRYLGDCIEECHPPEPPDAAQPPPPGPCPGLGIVNPVGLVDASSAKVFLHPGDLSSVVDTLDAGTKVRIGKEIEGGFIEVCTQAGRRYMRSADIDRQQ